MSSGACNTGPAPPDLDSPEHIRAFIEAFYRRLLADPVLGPIFTQVAEIDLERHLPLICAYWEKLLLGGRDYRRHTMDIHRELHARRPLQQRDFERWLHLFETTLDAGFGGPRTEQARRTARQIAANMAVALGTAPPGSS